MSQPPQFPQDNPWGQPSGNPSGDVAGPSSQPSYGQGDASWTSDPGYGQSSGSGQDHGQGFGQDQQLPGPPPPQQAPQYSQGSLPMGGPPPQQSGGGKGGKIAAIIGCVGCGVLTLIVIVILIIVLVVRGGGDEPTTDGGPQTSQDGGSGTGTTATDPASLESPHPAGTTLVIPMEEAGGEVEVTFSEVNWDAEEVLSEQDTSLEPAPEGQVYVLATATFTYSGEGTINPAFDNFVSFYGADGNEVTNEIVLSENSMLNVGDISDGASTDYDFVYLVPEDEAGTGTFEVSELLNFDGDYYYVAAS